MNLFGAPDKRGQRGQFKDNSFHLPQKTRCDPSFEPSLMAEYGQSLPNHPRYPLLSEALISFCLYM